MIVETFFLAEEKRAYGTLFFQDLSQRRARPAGCVRFMADSYKDSAGYFVCGGILVAHSFRAR
jgi:hypothetical protein